MVEGAPALSRRRRRSAQALVAVVLVGLLAGGAGFWRIERGREATRRARLALEEEVPVGEPPPGAGNMGGRFGNRRNLVARGGGSIATESAVEAGLKWLARHQSFDGLWKAEEFDAVCRGQCSGHGQGSLDVGLTGLALLAFLGAGYSPQHLSRYVDPVTGKEVRFGSVACRALAGLIVAQGDDGAFGSDVDVALSNQALATAAICEAYAITGARRYEGPARSGLEFLLRARNGDGGWGSAPCSGRSDALDTGWAVLALESAELAGIKVPSNLNDDARAWLDRTDAIPQAHATRVAVHLVAKAFPKKQPTKDGRALGLPVPAETLFLADLPAWSSPGASSTNDFDYWFWGTLAVYQTAGPAGVSWKKWNKAMVDDALVMNQGLRKDGCRDGSWECDHADAWTRARGRVASTALATLTLETYYRFPR